MGSTSMTAPPPPTPPTSLPGWYPAPDGGGGQKYWDGRSWLTEPPSSQSKKFRAWTIPIPLIMGVASGIVAAGITTAMLLTWDDDETDTAWVSLPGACLKGTSGGFQAAAPRAPTTPTAVTVEAHHLDPSTYERISPRDFALVVRDPEAHVGRKIIIDGRVAQFDSITGSSEFLAETSPDHLAEGANIRAPDQAILVDVVEEDSVTMHVEVAGAHKYTTTNEKINIVPEFYVYIIDVTSPGQ